MGLHEQAQTPIGAPGRAGGLHPERHKGRPGLTLLGVRVRVHVSWLLAALFIAASLAAGDLPMARRAFLPDVYGAMMLLIIAGIAASIVLHELVHALAGRAFGVDVDRITLFLFGGLADMRAEPTRAFPELVIALAGPALSLTLSLILAIMASRLDRLGAPNEATVVVAYLSTFNLVIAGFNLLPVYPLDGGRVLRALVWMATRDEATATRLVARLGQALAAGFVAAGVCVMLLYGAANGLWWILIGVFLYNAAAGALKAAQARRLFAGHPITELMTPAVAAAAADDTLEQFVDGPLLATRHRLYPVNDGRRWLGVVRPQDILAVPRSAWSTMTVRSICAPAAEVETAGPVDDAASVLDRMRSTGIHQMPVIRSGAVIGIITLEDLVGGFEIWRRFGAARA